MGIKRAITLGMLTGALVACEFQDSAVQVDELPERTVARGTIWYVEWVQADGKGTEGFVRSTDVGYVPGGNGNPGVDAYGKLTRDYLIIDYAHRDDLGPRVIPAGRLVDIQFYEGDADVENTPLPPSGR